MIVLSMQKRCDQVIHCKDNSDEKNCYLLVFKEEESYNKKVPPFSLAPDDSIIPVEVIVSTQLENVLEISEFSHTIDLKLGITLKWFENRLLYHNLKTKEALNILSDSEVSDFVILHFLYNLFRFKAFGFPTLFSRILIQMKLSH